MATPGMGARPGRKWGKRRKEHYPDQSQFAGHTMEDWDDTLPDSFYKAEVQPTRVLGLGHTGVMVALYPDADAAARIAQAAGVTEPIAGLHLTLCYLGDSSETPLATNKARLIGAVQQWTRAHGRVLRGELNGLGRFFHTEDDGTNAVWIAPDMPGLPELRQSLADWIERSGFDYAQNHGFTPHITVAYVPEGAPTPPIRVDGPIVFDHATLAWGDAQYDMPFTDATTKAKRITGNLFRADDGKFQAGGASSATPTRATPAIPRSDRGSPTELADAAGATADRARGGGAADLRAGMADLVGQARSKKPKKGGGGGGGKGKKAPKPKATPAERRAAQAQQRAQTADATAAQLGLAAADVAALRQAAEAGGAKSAALAKLGLIDAQGDATDAGRRALSALERGDVRGYRAAVQDAAERQGRAQARAGRQAAQTQRQAQRAEERAKRQAETDRRRAAQERRQARRDRTAAARAESAAQKAFTVYKAADGTPRWLARTTTAYRDRDGEILSVAALDADSQRMTQTKQFGPLRWWHVGRPDPANAAAPWGPGLDLGDCDYSAVIGRTRIESGTFKSAAIARAVARVADALALSPGFFHPPDAPDADGVFGAMHTFERSLVPTRYAQASNLFTGLTVKESSMDINEIERRFKAAIHELGLTREQALALGAQLVETEKTATAQGIAYKSTADAPAVYTAPDGTPGIIQDGRFVALKAAAPPAAAAAEDAPIAEKAPDMGAEIEDAGAELEDAGEYLGDLGVADFQAMLAEGLTQALAPLIKALDVTGKMAGHMEELKSMLGGSATKEAGAAAEIVAVKEQIGALTARLATLESDAPGEALGAAALAALKSSGPTAPPTPDGAPQIDPHNPLAALTAGLFPELYGGNRQ